jgi:hypothetical protein
MNQYDQYYTQTPNQNKRFVPISDVEFLSFTTMTTWGKNENVSPELSNKLKQVKYYKDTATEQIYADTTPLWEMLSFYTQDMRLANLDTLNDQFKYCTYYLDWAADALRNGYYRSFASALSKVITQLELSQSKGGFLRKRMGTVTSENKHEVTEGKKTTLFGGRKKED